MFDTISHFFDHFHYKKTVIALVVAAMLFLIALPIALLLYNMNQGVQEVAEDTVGRQPDPESDIFSEATLLQIVENPGKHYGRTVQVRGQIEEVYSDRIFTVTNIETYVDVMVVTDKNTNQEQPAQQLFNDNRPIEIQGEVQEYTNSEIEQKYNVTISDSTDQTNDTRPVISASTLSVAERE